MSDPAQTPSAPGHFTKAAPEVAQGPLARWQLRAALVACGVLFAAGLWTLHRFLPALGWAVIFAVSLWPWYHRQQLRFPRHVRLALPGAVTFLVVLAFVLPLIMVVNAIAHDSVGVAQWVAQASATGIPAPAFLTHLPLGGQATAWWQANLAQPGGLAHVTHTPSGALRLPMDTGEKLAGAVLHRSLLLLFMLLILFFLLRDGENVARGLEIGSRRAFGPAGERVGAQIVQAIRGTVNGLVVIGLGMGSILGVAYALLGVPHPALFGLLTGLLSAVPFGSVVAYVAAGILLAAAGDVGAGIGLIVFGSVLLFVADHFVRPALIGGSTRLPFLWVLLGILGGIEGWGLIGVVLGPAVMAALMLLWREWIGVQEGPLNPTPEALETP